MMQTLSKLVMLAALAAVLFGAAGCAEPENASARPWNSPEGFEGGALGGMNYQHQ
jgi:hypothetical protein